MAKKSGSTQVFGSLSCFIPDPLPPSDMSFASRPDIISACQETAYALGQLSQAGTGLRDHERFVKSFAIKEALLTSAIENINTTLVQVVTKTLDQELKVDKDTQLVVSYMAASRRAVEMITDEQMPICTRVILEAHRVLMETGAQKQSSPGALRKQAVKVGAHVPPPATKIPELMSGLESYINSAEDQVSPLIKAALAHVQFETIHPFLDGNGRIGRLLIMLMLIDSKLLARPVIYPSYYFKATQTEYYRCLDRVRTDSDWGGWVLYFVRCIEQGAKEALDKIAKIEALESQLLERFEQDEALARLSGPGQQLLLDTLFAQPVISIDRLAQRLDCSYNTAASKIELLVSAGILRQKGEGQRNRRFGFRAYLNLLE